MGQGRPKTRGNNAGTPVTKIGENQIPVTDDTVGRIVELPDLVVKPNYFGRSAMKGKLPKHMTTGRPKKKESNLVTDNPFAPKEKFKFKMPKLPKIKLSGKKRTESYGVSKRRRGI